MFGQQVFFVPAFHPVGDAQQEAATVGRRNLSP